MPLRITIPVVWRSLAARRSRASLAAGVGAVTGAGAYGYVVRAAPSRRHATRRCRSSACRPRSTACASASSPTSIAAAWSRTTTSPARSQMLMAEQPDLIVLGGDYVTWGDRALRRPVGRGARAAVARRTASSRILGNHDDDHDMPAALARNGIAVLKDARTRLTIRGETDRSRRHPLLDETAARHRRADARRGRRRRSCSRTIRGGSPRRRRSTCRWCCPATRTAARSCCRCVGAIAAAEISGRRGHRPARRTTMFVSRGVGTVYVPVRINCPPEVAMLTLQPA